MKLFAISKKTIKNAAEIEQLVIVDDNNTVHISKVDIRNEFANTLTIIKKSFDIQFEIDKYNNLEKSIKKGTAILIAETGDYEITDELFANFNPHNN